MTTGGGITVLVLLVVIGFFLTLQAAPALHYAGFGFFSTVEFNTTADSPVFGVLGMLTGTITVALVAVLVAVPISILAALFITNYAGARLRGLLTGLVDLLAAIPSLLYGLWGSASWRPRWNRSRRG